MTVEYHLSGQHHQETRSAEALMCLNATTSLPELLPSEPGRDRQMAWTHKELDQEFGQSFSYPCSFGKHTRTLCLVGEQA